MASPDSRVDARAWVWVLVSTQLLCFTACSLSQSGTETPGRPATGACLEKATGLDQAKRTLRIRLETARVTLTYEGTFGDAFAEIALAVGHWVPVHLPNIPYPGQEDCFSRRVAIDVRDTSLWDILVELGRQASTGEPLIVTDRHDGYAFVTYRRPELTREEAARLEGHARAALRRLLVIRKKDQDLLTEQEDEAASEATYVAVLCAPPPRLVDMLVEEVRNKTDAERKAAAEILAILFRLYSDGTAEVRVQPAFVLSDEVIETAQRKAIDYLEPLLLSDNQDLVWAVESALRTVERKANSDNGS
jgi:hypothetical protein